MPLTLFRPRRVWMPTAAGWAVLLLMLTSPAVLWCFCAESFLSVTDRVAGSVLVVEAWTGAEGADAAAREFRSRPQYRYIVVAGGLTGEPWTRRRWSYPELAAEELRRDGIPGPVIIQARRGDVRSQRTYQTALAARRSLEARGLFPNAINVLTQSVHARRSRLVYQRAFGMKVQVGVISWRPAGSQLGHWWSSSNRALDLIKESLAYPWEALFHSGRGVVGPWPRAEASLSRGARLPPSGG